MAEISERTRLIVAARAQYCCEYCLAQSKYSESYFTIDHHLPQVLGGSDLLRNLVWACMACYNHKFNFTSGFDLLEGREVPLFNPRIHVWAEHFCWLEGYGRVGGLTAIGRVTEIRLKMNRPALVNLRLALVKSGQHPPNLAL